MNCKENTPVKPGMRVTSMVLLSICTVLRMESLVVLLGMVLKVAPYSGRSIRRTTLFAVAASLV